MTGFPPEDHGAPAPKRSFARSGLVTAAILAAAFAIFGGLWIAHLRGSFHKLTTQEVPPETPAPYRPGGQEILHLTRAENTDAMTPEFLSAVLLPGIGMQMLQATAYLPGHGETAVLDATPEAEVKAETEIAAAGFSVLMQTREGSHWSRSREVVLGHASQRQSTDVLPDGASATALFGRERDAATGELGPSNGLETRITTAVTSHSMDLTIAARNVGDAPRNLILSWQPRFRALGAGLKALTLTPPPAEDSGTPAGPFPLGQRSIDKTYTGLKHSYLSNGPEVRLTDRTEGYVLHLTALTTTIRSLHIQADATGKSTLVAFSTAAADGKQDDWTQVKPGETLQWRVRVEVTSAPGGALRE